MFKQIMAGTLFWLGVSGLCIQAKAPLFDNLGDHHYVISTKNSEAQRFFDQGLVLWYAFEWGESIRSFEEAARLDPTCAMCYWGLALALGSKENEPMDGHEYEAARAAIQRAVELKANASPIEQDYIDALFLRYPVKSQEVKSAGTFSCHKKIESKEVEQAIEVYVGAMKKVTERYPEDHEAKMLYVAALFKLWQAGDKNLEKNIYTVPMINLTKEVLNKNALHPGAHHYHIHVVEGTAHPENAIESARALETLVLGSGHMMHMPSHICFLTGNYHGASTANMKGIAAYKQYAKTCKEQGFLPQITYLSQHNFDFLRSSATMEGRQAVALSAAQELVESVLPEWIEKDHNLQGFLSAPLFVKARFHQWKAILKTEAPLKQYQYASGMWHYARGLAWAHTHNRKNAQQEFIALKEIIQNSAHNKDEVLGESGFTLLSIAHKVLSATIAKIDNDKTAAITALKEASALQSGMPYHEPPDWYFPVDEALGDAYLHWADFSEAVEMYQQALHKLPKNPWALFGLIKSLEKLNRQEEARRTQQEFKHAWQYADIPVPLSLF